MKHFASSSFWTLHSKLPIEVRELADKNYQLLKDNPRHPSLHFKRIEEVWSVRVGHHYRAIGIDVPREFNGYGSARTLNTTAYLADSGGRSH